MITALETTVWDDKAPNCKYILSDDMSTLYAYVKHGDYFPTIFKTPMRFDARRRTFKILARTKDFDPDSKVWHIKGSKGTVHTVTFVDHKYNCSCPSAKFRGGFCKHIDSVQKLTP